MKPQRTDRSAAIVSRWTRILAFGCSHGSALRTDARAAILAMRKAWNPGLVLHLGDAFDTTAFRSGAHGTKDEAAPVSPDIDAGLEFIVDAGCTHFFSGNHEARIFAMQDNPNALKANCADKTIAYVRAHLRAHGVKWIEPWPDWRMFGGVKFGHGIIFNELYLRDTAESFGPSCIAHGHRAGVATGRRSDNPQCYGVGTLTDRGADEMGYAKARRSTLAWSSGFVWGEVSANKAQLWLHDNGQRTEWRLPV